MQTGIFNEIFQPMHGYMARVSARTPPAEFSRNTVSRGRQPSVRALAVFWEILLLIGIQGLNHSGNQ